ncbi:MAG: P-II family nitrogen regulator [Nitrospiraceae bacterium]|nr:MAG: P-II family nitrogen regulator [Nitrospiraceae bacterium]
MKKIDAVIMPFRLDAVKDVLCSLGLHGMTITEIKVPGAKDSHAGILKRTDCFTEFIPKLMIEIIVPDSIAEKTVEMINRSVNLQSDMNDRIFISDIEEAVRISTAQKGEDAIT